MLVARSRPGVAAALAAFALSQIPVAAAQSLRVAQALGEARADRSRPPAEAGSAMDLRLAQAVGEEAGPAPAENTPAVPDTAPDRSADKNAIAWGLAPIRWRGLLATDARYLRSEGQSRRLQLVDSGQFDASSYVWQPWFAQITGGVGFLVSRERSTTSDTDRSSGRSVVLTGNGAASVFPSSRFPFQAHFNVSDSRLSDQFVGQDYSQQRFGVRQSYRNEVGDANYSASYDVSSLRSSVFGRDTVSVFNANLNQRYGAHTIDGGANHTSNTRGNSGELSNFHRGFARHSYSSEGLLTSDTTVSYATSDLRLGSAGALTQTRSDIAQLNSFVSWRPEMERPLYVTGGVRYFMNDSSGLAGATNSQSATAFAAAMYNPMRQLTLSASASASAVDSGSGGGATITTQTVGANYLPDVKDFGGMVYGTSFGTSLTNVTNTQSGNRFALGGQANHHLQKTFPLGQQSTLSFLASQGYSVTNDSVAGSLHTLTHNGSASLRVSAGNSLSGYTSIGAGDSRTRGYNPTQFQLLNLQVSGQAQFGRYDSMTANLTVQGTRQETPTQPANGFNVSTNGNATYQHVQLFGVPRLRYQAIYSRNDMQLNTRLQGDLSAPRELFGASLEQRLEYRVGRIDMRLTARLAQVDGRKNALLFFRIARQIGDP